MNNLRSKIITTLLIGSSLVLGCEKYDLPKNNPKDLSSTVPEISKLPYNLGINLPLLLHGKTSDISLILVPSVDIDSVSVRVSTDWLNIIIIPDAERDYHVSVGYIQNLYFDHGLVKKGEVFDYKIPITYISEGDFSLGALISVKYKDGESAKIRNLEKRIHYSSNDNSFSLN